MREKILSSDLISKLTSTHENSKLFDEYLSDYQEDIIKIVGKHRHSNHALSHDEVISESNILLIKSKGKILEKLDKDFSHVNFKKMAFAFVRNAISWSHYAEYNSKDSKNLLDNLHQGEDGPMTTYELAIETQCIEDDIDSITDVDHLKQFIHVLINYSYLLTENEIKIISYVQKGLSQDQISEKLNVTHQAVSFAVVKLKQKLKSQFNFNDIYNQKEPKGQSCLEALFRK
jgi:RNA polymerase sigma factor (sigma-70 family)